MVFKSTVEQLTFFIILKVGMHLKIINRRYLKHFAIEYNISD